jgi:Domain of unknown function (DUF4388)
MAIEGPLRELGIHDVFQLLDLSRKTGVLRVASELRDDEGVVYFDSGRVVHAHVRSKAVPLELTLLQSGKISKDDLESARAKRTNGRANADLVDLLVEGGAVTSKEIERQLRMQIESVVFELMSWREGFFSFEERDRLTAPIELALRVSTESLLMEGARRIDEWSRIERRVPHLGVVPQLVAMDDDRETTIDLRPSEWAVVAEIDGVRDLRGIAAAVARSEFDVAKIAYGLASTGIIELRDPKPEQPTTRNTPTVHEPVASDAASERAMLRALHSAMDGWERSLAIAPEGNEAERARAALEAAARLREMLEMANDVH